MQDLGRFGDILPDWMGERCASIAKLVYCAFELMLTNGS